MGNNMRVISLKDFQLSLVDRTIKFREVKAVEALGGVCLISNPLIIKLKKRDQFVCAFVGNEFIGCATGLPEFILDMLDRQERAGVEGAVIRIEREGWY
jgi:hypothetical protein